MQADAVYYLNCKICKSEELFPEDVARQSANCRATVVLLSADCRSTVGDSRPIVGRRPAVGCLLANC